MEGVEPSTIWEWFEVAGTLKTDAEREAHADYAVKAIVEHPFRTVHFLLIDNGVLPFYIGWLYLWKWLNPQTILIDDGDFRRTWKVSIWPIIYGLALTFSPYWFWSGTWVPPALRFIGIGIFLAGMQKFYLAWTTAARIGRWIAILIMIAALWGLVMGARALWTAITSLF